LSDVTSTQTAKLFIYDLTSKSFVTNFDPYDISTDMNSFVGDMSISNHQSSYVDDVLFFGTVGGTTAAPTGDLKRLELVSQCPFKYIESLSNNVCTDTASPISDSRVSSVFSSLVNQPISVAPYVVTDSIGVRWVYFGTGRLFNAMDNASQTQQTFYGVRLPTDYSSYTNSCAASSPLICLGDLLNVTDIKIFKSGVLAPFDLEIPLGNEVDTFNQLDRAIDQHKMGWKINLRRGTSSPSSRVLDIATSIGSLIMFSQYEPSSNLCEPIGSSRLSVVNFRTGTVTPAAPIGYDAGSTITVTENNGTNETYEMVLRDINISNGAVFKVTAKRNTNTTLSDGIIVGGTSDGAILNKKIKLPNNTPKRQSWREM
jgi:type IV pilus assembly protein PilY1